MTEKEIYDYRYEGFLIGLATGIALMLWVYFIYYML